MQIQHQSRVLWYRAPYGARHTDDALRLRLAVLTRPEQVDFILCHYAYGLRDFDQGTIMMQVEADSVSELADEPAEPRGFGPTAPQRGVPYVARFRVPGRACLLFYWFEIRMRDRRVLYLSRSGREDGSAQLSDQAPDYRVDATSKTRPWQVTVYESRHETPDWFAGGLMYQIFPDRFRRGPDYSYRAMRAANPRPERIYHRDWLAEVDIEGKGKEGYLACDFFGGTLRGIIEKLDYIASLGVTVLYLNPIFMARSNHRYDTADYREVDPMLGQKEDFVALCREAGQRGIRILLDGVFSHTGADSLYFNKYGRFPGKGAWQAALERSYSPYFGWYDIHVDRQQVSYRSWWDFPELPAVREHDLSFRDFILGPDGVVRYWLRLGASGYRLDVSDELPDAFLRELYQVVKDEKPDAVVMGEVWEDASNKISYGNYRDFLLGRSHDTVMGYVFRDAVLAFFRGDIAADQLVHRLETLREHYPPAAYVSSMNLLSSHDIARFITAVAGDPDPGERSEQINLRLSPEQRRRGEGLLRLATFLQYALPGTPSLYYGDEIGMEGYRDPFNRRCFDWSRSDTALREDLAALGRWRRAHPLLGRGHLRWLSASGRVLCLKREYIDGVDMLGRPREAEGPYYVLVNAGEETAHLEADGRCFIVPPWTAQLLGEEESLLMSMDSLSSFVG